MKTTEGLQKSDIYGIIGAIVSCLLVFLILWFVMMPYNQREEEEGIIVSFGDNLEGGGTENTYVPEQISRPSIPSPPTSNRQEELLTQTDPSVAIAEQKRKEKERLEKERIEKERREEQKRQEEQARREQEAIDKANALANVFGSNTQGGSGNTSGNTQQGNPVGKGNSGGNSWSLSGRSLVGSLVTPAYDRNVEGIITVNIRVDASGKVLSASIGSPTTISDNVVRNATIDAAKKTRFSSGSGVSTGTITYNFRLR